MPDDRTVSILVGMSTPLTDEELAAIPTVDEATNELGLTWLAKRVYGAMRGFAEPGGAGECFAAPKTIAAKIGRSIAAESVVDAIAELSAKGFVVDAQRERGRQRVWRLERGPLEPAATRLTSDPPPGGGALKGVLPLPAPDGEEELVGASPLPADAGEAPTRKKARRPIGENLASRDPDAATYLDRCCRCEHLVLANRLIDGFCFRCAADRPDIDGPHAILLRLQGFEVDEFPSAGRGVCDDDELHIDVELRAVGSVRVCVPCLTHRLRRRERAA